MRGRHALRIAVVLIASGAMAGFTLSFFVAQSYTAEAALALVQAPGSQATSSQAPGPQLLRQAWEMTLAQDYLVALINRSVAYSLVLVNPEEMVEIVRRDVVVEDTRDGGAAGLSIRYSNDSDETALSIVKMLVAGVSENAAAIRRAPSTARVTRIVEPPRVFVSEGGRAWCVAAGAGVGALLAMAAAVAIGMTRWG